MVAVLEGLLSFLDNRHGGRSSSSTCRSRDRDEQSFAHQRRLTMNWDIVKGKWNQVVGQLKSKWGKLSDDDWTTIGGKKDALVGKIQERYGYKKEQAEKEADEFIKGL